MTKPKSKKKGVLKRSLEQRYEDFVEAYLSNGGDHTKAALAAGYSKGGASKAGYRLSKNVQVLSMLDKRRTVIFDNLQITTERILQERARLAFFDPQKLYDKNGQRIPIHQLDADTAAAIAGVEHDRFGRIKIKLADKNASLTSLEKQRGMYAADNAQLAPAIREGDSDDLIEGARAIAFALARAVHAMGKQK